MGVRRDGEPHVLDGIKWPQRRGHCRGEREKLQETDMGNEDLGAIYIYLMSGALGNINYGEGNETRAC